MRVSSDGQRTRRGWIPASHPVTAGTAWQTEPRPEPCGTPQESESVEEERLPALTEKLGLLWTASQTSTRGLGGVMFLLIYFTISVRTGGIYR